MDDPARRPDETWPRDRPVRWRGVASNLTWFVVGTLAGLLQIALAIPVLSVTRGWLSTALAVAWGGLTLFAAWSWVRGRWRIVLAPLLTIAAILGVMAFERATNPASSGPVLTDNPAGVVEGVEYRPAIDPATFSTTIDNRYMPLVPGTRRTYAGGGERVVITVTSATRTVMGVETVVVRDREYRGDALIEDTADWFAQDAAGNVWYFGEDTAECQDGRVANQHGAWEAGVDGAQPGIVMLAEPRVGDYYRQEYYRGQAEDVARVLELGGEVEHDGQTYRDVLVTEDFTALEPGQLEHKSYASGIGLIEERPARGGGGIRLTQVEEGIDPTDPGAEKPCQG